MRFIILAALLLSGCGVATPHPVVEHTVVEKVPVAVTCYKAADLPVEPAKVAKDLTGDAMHDLDLISASALRLRRWGQSEAALLAGCTVK
ncbi:hypothetical protein D3Y57_09860 [Sphingomonas paeninsulae]|uniref:Lipoprotein n=1 Tax=Sphingomonas paeninsulae TaxID=2319844 RepID=A0A494TMB1_SPHPE|nr:hypothetical protein [Sphingomonas paeninsulae]AYJ86215.1 hypothetical protein D3Y57_09860 [Sphingomonas paeninsulae]